MLFAIETNHLSRRFRNKEAVIDLTLKVPEGSIFAFIGCCFSERLHAENFRMKPAATEQVNQSAPVR